MILEARKEKALTGLTPPAEAAASQKWKIIYLQVLSAEARVRAVWVKVLRVQKTYQQ